MIADATLFEPESLPPTVTRFPRTIARAVSRLKNRLQQDYEAEYPGLSEIIRLVLDEEEARAWDLTSFPHLVLPDMVDAHIAALGLSPSHVSHEDVAAPLSDRQLILAAG